MSFNPVNYQKRDQSSIDRDLDYALLVAHAMRSAVTRTGLSVEGLRILELGPGSDFGAELILASMGARITLADRFLTSWDSGYHPEFYSKLIKRCSGFTDQLEIVVTAGNHEASTLRFLEEPAEELSSVSDASIDFVYSNAVLEHISDIVRVASEAARVTTIGGFGYHQIDMRYHRDFAKPLDHLLVSDRKFKIAAESVHFEFGNGIRSVEFWTHFEKSGFKIIERSVNATADPVYLASVLPRLRAGPSSYRNWPEPDLMRVGAYFLMERTTAAEALILRERACDVLDLLRALKAPSSEARTSSLTPTGLAERQLDASNFSPLKGYGWVYSLPEIPMGDDVDNGFRSELEFYEDGSELGPAHTIHAALFGEGRGRFSHWRRDLFLSTSDNSSPVENGRKYSIRFPADWLTSDNLPTEPASG